MAGNQSREALERQYYRVLIQIDDEKEMVDQYNEKISKLENELDEIGYTQARMTELDELKDKLENKKTVVAMYEQWAEELHDELSKML
ncbi:hypothetical protein A2U01_0001290 [Trifolium medium]|uniref:Uncharacterized protein n=1 Tax=Trifolium medium TaxID=97028 RepID=A0A392LZV4_9FABA|nr:hypothetical protein [Trifolium medium]